MVRLTRTNRSGQILNEEVYLTKSGGSYKISGKGYEIPTDKVYHPLSEYWTNPTLKNKIRCEMGMALYRGKMKNLAKRKGSDVHSDNYGVYLKHNGTDYYFQFREKDYEKLVKL